MTIENAFKELISANPKWHELLVLAEKDAKEFSDAFASSGAGELEVRKVLSYAGYVMTESWSKNLGPQIQQDAPKQGIVLGDPKKS